MLNSIIYLRKSTDLLSQYDHIHAYLDNDEAGRKAVQTLKDILVEKVIDHTADYKGCKDLNEYLVKNQQNMHHGIKDEFLQEYLNEFCYKFNRRYFGDRVFDRLVIAAISYKPAFEHRMYGSLSLKCG